MKMNSMIAATAVVLFASWTSSVLAENSHTAANSGTILFTGSIVESPCDYSTHQRQLQVSCLRNGQTQIKTLAMNSTALQALPYDIGSSQVKWLNGQHKVAVVIVDYQ